MGKQKDMGSKFLTPTLSELAYEQIIDWYEHNSGSLYKGQSTIDTKGMDIFSLNKNLESVGASLSLLHDNYIVQNLSATSQNSTLNQSFRGAMHLVIDMGKLEARISAKYFPKHFKGIQTNP